MPLNARPSTPTPRPSTPATRPSTPAARHFDAIVVGLGGVGSAALFHLARRGARVLGIDRFAPPHDRGSSHGHTRIIRQAYFEHPDYVPLTKAAYQLWHDLGQHCGRQLYHQVGLLEVGPPEGIVVPGVLHSAARHGLAVQQLTATEVAVQYPGFTVAPDAVAVFERDAGYLLVEDCLEACSDPRYRADRGCPLFFYETAKGCFYGFPQNDARGVKVAEHSGGETVSDPARVSRDVDAIDRRRVEGFLQAHLKGVSTQATDHTVCLYTMSPDEHFIIDRHPQHAHVVFAAGLSGHGFKFTPVLGQVLADLVLDGTTAQPIQFLTAQRAGLSGGS